MFPDFDNQIFRDETKAREWSNYGLMVQFARIAAS
jgi:hypothetical protein